MHEAPSALPFFDGMFTKDLLLFWAALRRPEATSLDILRNTAAKGFSLLDHTTPLSFVSVSGASTEEPQRGLQATS